MTNPGGYAWSVVTRCLVDQSPGVRSNRDMSGHQAVDTDRSLAAMRSLSGPDRQTRSTSRVSGIPAANSLIGWRASSGRRMFSMSKWFGRTGHSLHVHLDENSLLPSYDCPYTRREVVQR